VAPVRGLFAIGRLLQEEVDQQLYNPTQVRRQIEEIEAAQAEGKLSDGEAQEQQQEAVNRLLRR
jgi:hypothetical protein